jgi:hypothetical protein
VTTQPAGVFSVLGKKNIFDPWRMNDRPIGRKNDPTLLKEHDTTNAVENEDENENENHGKYLHLWLSIRLMQAIFCGGDNALWRAKRLWEFSRCCLDDVRFAVFGTPGVFLFLSKKIAQEALRNPHHGGTEGEASKQKEGARCMHNTPKLKGMTLKLLFNGKSLLVLNPILQSRAWHEHFIPAAVKWEHLLAFQKNIVFAGHVCKTNPDLESSNRDQAFFMSHFIHAFYLVLDSFKVITSWF